MGEASIPSGPVTGRRLSGHNWRLYAAVGLFYILLIPPPFNPSFGPVLMPPYRVLLLVAAVPVMIDILRGRLRFILVDYAMLLFAAWIAASSFAVMGPVRAFEAAGALVVDIAVPYLWLRSAIKSARDVRLLLILVAPGIGLLGALLAVESISKSQIAIPLASQVTGQFHNVELSERLGLLRAQGPFPHPILAGVFLASFLPLYALSSLRGWPLIVGVLGSLCSFFTLSSAALLVLAASFAALLANWVVEKTSLLSWRLIFLAIIAIIVFLETASNSGTVGLITRFAALNEQTAYFRLLIWDEGVKNVLANPLFGSGYNDWIRPAWMPPSVDNYWLVLAMRHGVIAPFLVLFAVVFLVAKLGKQSVGQDLASQRLTRAAAIAIAVFCLSLFSVAVWLSAQVWFYAVLGIATSVAYQSKAESDPTKIRYYVLPHPNAPKPLLGRPNTV